MDKTTETETLTTSATDITESIVSANEETVTDTPETAPQTEKAAKPDGNSQEKTAEVYELKAPEGVEMASETLEGVKGLAQELGLSNEQGQKLVDFGGVLLKQWAGQMQAHQAEIVKEWGDQVRADKEIGGNNFDQSIAKAIEVRKAIFPDNDPESKAFNEFLNESGLGNHPVLLKAFVRMQKMLGDDTLVSGNSAPVSQKSREELYYGKG